MPKAQAQGKDCAEHQHLADAVGKRADTGQRRYTVTGARADAAGGTKARSRTAGTKV